MQGYCYQFWRCRHNAFRADGAFGQYIIVMPEQDAVIAITSETADMQSELNLVWKYLLPAMRPTALSVNSEADTKLDMDLDALALPPLPAYTTEISPDIVGRLFSLKANPLQIGSIEIRLKHDTCELLMGINSGVNKLDFGSGKWLPGLTNLPGPSLLLGAKEDISFLAPYKVDGSYTWRDGNILELKLRYIESPHTETITCHFNPGKLDATVEYSFYYGHNKIELQSE
jgi:hypothetical protein